MDGPLAVALGRSPLALIAGDTYEHYQEHTETIRAWLACGVEAHR